MSISPEGTQLSSPGAASPATKYAQGYKTDDAEPDDDFRVRGQLSTYKTATPPGWVPVDADELWVKPLRVTASAAAEEDGNTPEKARRRVDATTSALGLSIQDLVSMAMEEPERVMSNLDQCFVVTPDCAFRTYWDIGSLVLLLYVALFTPLQIAFLAEKMEIATPGKWPFFFAIDRVIDVVFVMDIVINFRSAWFTNDGVMVFVPRIAASRYLRGWFGLDLISVLPWDALSLVFKGGALLRVPKLLRLFRLAKLLKVLRASRVIRRLERELEVKYGYVRLGKFGIAIMFAGHWMACGLMLVSELSEEDADSWRYNLYCSAYGDECTTSNLYVAALHWAIMTLTTIGYGDISPRSMGEQVYVILSMLVGAGFFSFVVGTCCSLVEGLDGMNVRFQENLDSINDYMELCQMPKKLRKRIRDYVWNYKEVSSRKNQVEILASMSPSLKQEVLLFNYGEELMWVQHFRGAPKHFLCLLAMQIQHRMYGPGDIIVNEGDFGEPFALLKKGEVTLIRTWVEGPALVGRFKNRGFWNERAIVFNSPADTTVKATVFSETHVLEVDVLKKLMSQYPNGVRVCKKLIVRRLWKLCIDSGFFYLAMGGVGDQKEAGAGGAGREGSSASEHAEKFREFTSKASERRLKLHKTPAFLKALNTGSA